MVFLNRWLRCTYILFHLACVLKSCPCGAIQRLYHGFKEHTALPPINFRFSWYTAHLLLDNNLHGARILTKNSVERRMCYQNVDFGRRSSPNKIKVTTYRLPSWMFLYASFSARLKGDTRSCTVVMFNSWQRKTGGSNADCNSACKAKEPPTWVTNISLITGNLTSCHL